MSTRADNYDAPAAKAAMEWYLEHGVEDLLADAPVDRTDLAPPKPVSVPNPMPNKATQIHAPQSSDGLRSTSAPEQKASSAPLGLQAAAQQSLELAKNANTLEELRDAIANFDGLALKRTATNMVFSDGNPEARIMLVGEAPGADEDRQGKPFVGQSGQLLDKILASIGLSRAGEDMSRAVYISNMLNWRPPGNRTPTPAEIEISLPFIEKHIMLVKPQILILCGGVSAKSLLGSNVSVSKLRKKWHDYKPLNTELHSSGASPIKAIVTYHPAYLLRTPIQKRAVWQDMLMLQESLEAE